MWTNIPLQLWYFAEDTVEEVEEKKHKKNKRKHKDSECGKFIWSLLALSVSSNTSFIRLLLNPGMVGKWI